MTTKPLTLQAALLLLRATDKDDADVTQFILDANDSDADSTKRLAYYHHLGLFRIRAVEDTSYNISDLLGDCYNPVACPDIAPAELKRQEKNERARIHRQGVWGFVLECRKSSADNWGAAFADRLDSLWGNIGADFIGSGYDQEFLVTALEWLEENEVAQIDPQAVLVSAVKKALCGMRALIANRPDLMTDVQPYCRELIQALAHYDMPGAPGVSPPRNPHNQDPTTAPVLGYDGFGFNVIADPYRARFAKVQDEFRPGHEREAEGAAILAALFASGAVAQRY
jgi:hypothetical protein